MALSTEQLRAQLQRRLETEQAKQEKSKRTTARLKAQARDLARQEQLAWEAQVGRLAGQAGLRGADPEALLEAFTLIARLMKNGRLRGWSRMHDPDPTTDAEIQRLLDDHVTLVVVGEDGVPLTREAKKEPVG